MKIYVDLLFFLNTAFDFLLLLTVNIILRRNVKLLRIMFGALFGGSSIFILFFKINSFELFILKILISIIMILITFKFKNKKYFFKNLFFLYTASMILGGFLYFLNVEFSYKQEGLVFYHNGLSINFIFLIITSPLILYIYIRQGIKLKTNYSKYYKVNIYIDNKKIRLTGFLDTGNKLKDPYSKKPIIIVNERLIKNKKKYYYIPIKTINEESLIKCIKPDKIEIESIGYKDAVIGLSKTKIDEDVDCILQESLLEG